MNLLARREHGYQELFQKLRKSPFNESDIRIVLDKLEHEGLLSNSRFIQNYILARANKGFGPIKIRAELLERGIHSQDIEEHLNIADNAWQEKAAEARQKRFKEAIPRDFKSRAREMRFLHYRGFTTDHIERLFRSDDEI